ncbi:hypothetical protein B7L70_09480 [Vulcanisaeta sp. EB80]|uniref:hypothetical protein n=1 Tax=Vulcanisaeta sp. EB80 TaxID=1650660 RepID=UPI0009BCC621|nr:hypothetical protein [Vulcanisaeta sp. EB80]PLC66995.1 hypothetical protein B7L70_09480 [Vulcanisaeta sp. EB80]
MSFVPVYERDLEVPIKISKTANEEARKKRLERWPREAGLTVPLDDSGTNFMQLVKSFSTDYGLTPGERTWDVKDVGGKYSVSMVWKLMKGNEEKGYARVSGEIPLTPTGEEGSNVVYTARLKYVIEISNDVLGEKATVENVPEVNLFG